MKTEGMPLDKIHPAARKAGNSSCDLAGPVDFLPPEEPSLRRLASTLRSRAASSSGRKTAVKLLNGALASAL